MKASDGYREVFAKHTRPIALAIGLLLLTLLAGTGLLGLAGHFLTAAALAGTAAVGFNFFGPSSGIRALTFARILSRYAEKLVGHDVTLRLARDLRVWFFARVLPLAPLELGRHRVGDLLARLVADIETVDGLLVRAIGPLLALSGLALVCVAVALVVLPSAGMLLAVMVLLLGFAIPVATTMGARTLERERADSRAALRYVVQEAIEGAADLAALDAGDDWITRIDQRSRALAQCERARKRRLSAGTAAHALIAALTLPVVLWLLLDAAYIGTLSPPAAAGLLFMTVALLEAAAGIGLAWQSWQAAKASSRRLRQIAGQTTQVVIAEPRLPVPETGELQLSNVRFRWPGDPRWVLDGIDLRLRPGERVALCGDSGAGKSSVMALVLRLCDPEAGDVRFGGSDLRHFDPAQWQRRLAWLPQEAPVFAGRVRDNLRMGDPDADDARLWDALAQVKLEALFRESAHGLDTWVGENGATLSAGQSRRLALARALLRDSPILLLDEPTEGLDHDTATELLQDLALASGHRSVLMISHDDLPAGVVHRRYRLLDGRLWEEGALPVE
ncbi:MULTISPECIES: thiol reductant ABC exporter subunit CydC [unclassified Pseudoxanthomonas]|uniref:thiol reductant ABC exporter subunit CydC n=1 Tax=unclassified Pseudoxanthomonas TaxID=2645906 RepID=UPI003077266B